MIDVATSQEVPSQIVTVDGQTYLRILASDVPSVGYKVFEIQAGPGTITDGGTNRERFNGRDRECGLSSDGRAARRDHQPAGQV